VPIQGNLHLDARQLNLGMMNGRFKNVDMVPNDEARIARAVWIRAAK
jgi:hypothetical protein